MTQSTQFHFRVGFFSLCLVLFFICCALGVWQLQRYQYKKLILSQYQQSAMESPKEFATLIIQGGSLQFKHVAVTGTYLNELTLFVQNKIYKDQMGFEVLTPVKIAGENKLLLVDRGWVAAEKQLFPRLAPVHGRQQLTGRVKLLDEYQFILGKNVLEPGKRPLVIQKININEISQLTKQDYYPFILRLDLAAKNGFVRDWPVVTVEPKRHIGYAIQWFLLAIILLVGYVCFSLEKVKKP